MRLLSTAPINLHHANEIRQSLHSKYGVRNFRYFSSQKGSEKGDSEKDAATLKSGDAATSNAPTTATTTSTTPHSNASVVAQQQFQRLKGVVTDLNLGDQVAVVLISVLTILILASPYIMKQIKTLEQDDYDDFFASSDVIDDLSKLARTEWGKEEEVILEDGESKTFKYHNALEPILQDVMQSRTLQQAAQQFVVTVVSSEPVKTALNKLLAELFRDLINDKETVAQVIQVCNKVIQDENIKRAVQQLVLEIVDDPQVKDSIVAMLQKMAREEPVPTTITELLKQSAHATLNDSDVLDHSMEFATDVLGDDIVQRTAGEALRNSLGHAVRPASTIVFTTVGIGLLVSSIMAVGYARSTEQEVHLFENAVKSLANNAAFGIRRMLTWPNRAFGGAGRRVSNVLLFPVRAIWSLFKYIGAGASRLLDQSRNGILMLPARGIECVFGSFEYSRRFVASSLSSLATIIVDSLLSLVACVTSMSSSALTSILTRTNSLVSEAGAYVAAACRKSATWEFLSRFGGEWTWCFDQVNNFLAKLALTIEDGVVQLRGLLLR
ncbi:hypothetical protein MPSEU_000681300 [Mayamaea pseudoterrestris]|nr:hypothetical protein MPSEU_000681300 [Mayamaea pseudoterrestris]